MDWPAHWADSREATAALQEVDRLVQEGSTSSAPLVTASDYAQQTRVQVGPAAHTTPRRPHMGPVCQHYLMLLQRSCHPSSQMKELLRKYTSVYWRRWAAGWVDLHVLR